MLAAGMTRCAVRAALHVRPSTEHHCRRHARSILCWCIGTTSDHPRCCTCSTHSNASGTRGRRRHPWLCREHRSANRAQLCAVLTRQQHSTRVAQYTAHHRATLPNAASFRTCVFESTAARAACDWAVPCSQRANFDILDLNPVKRVHASTTPVRFAAHSASIATRDPVRFRTLCDNSRSLCADSVRSLTRFRLTVGPSPSAAHPSVLVSSGSQSMEPSALAGVGPNSTGARAGAVRGCWCPRAPMSSSHTE